MTPATTDPIHAIALEALDHIYIDRIVAILAERDDIAIQAIDRLPDAVRARYEECAALALRSSGLNHWPAVYAALEGWVGDVESKSLPVERLDLVQVVAGIIASYRSFLVGRLPADLRERFERIAANDLGRDPDAFMAAREEPRR